MMAMSAFSIMTFTNISELTKRRHKEGAPKYTSCEKSPSSKDANVVNVPTGIFSYSEAVSAWVSKRKQTVAMTCHPSRVRQA